jgi:ribosomal protein S12 methylthiotransferase RimO
MMKIFFETLGCPKNQNDTEAAEGILEQAGHTITESAEDADVLILNTCGFIEDAKKESIDRVFELIKYNDESAGDGKKKLLIMSGCLSQRYGEELFEELPEVDIFLGVNDYQRLPQIIEEHKKGVREKHLSLYEKDMDTLTRRIKKEQYTATIKIAEGCNNKCTYCIIPKIRGLYRSVPMKQIIEEAKILAEAGCRELILIAEDTSAYGMDIYGEYRLPMLLHKLCEVDGIEWIRIMYCYEDRISDELIKAMASEEKVCNYIDIPLQHACDRILKAMARPTNKQRIRDVIGKLRKAMPDIHIRTTLITGFPGETEEDFGELYDFCEEMKFERLGVFSYSREEGTAAAEMTDQVDDGIKEERRDAIMRMQMDISLENNRKKIGTVQQVIIESRDSDGTYIGRTRYDAPEIDDQIVVASRRDHKPGDIIEVTVTDAFDYDLVGTERGEQIESAK